MKNLLWKSLLHERPWMWKALLPIVLLAAFGLRMINLTNPPLDFAPTRQMFSALKARGMYYQYVSDVPASQRLEAESLGETGDIEPPILETLVSQTYRLTGEHLWIARIYSSLFWILGGVGLFLLMREFASTGAAFIGLLFYLFLPFAVLASRAFMPDPLMVALIVFSLWALFRWQNTSKWKWAVLFGIFGGAALFAKNVAVFFVLGAFAAVLLGTRRYKSILRDPQVWVMLALVVLPVAAYMVYGMFKLNMAGQFALRFFPKMWIDPAFYFRWAFTVNVNISLLAALFGVLGIFLAGHSQRPLLVGLWIGYLLFGLTFSYHIYSHDYYQLPFIPVVALSLTPGLKLLLEQFTARNPGLFSRLALAVIVLVGVAVPAWYVRDLIVNNDYHNEPAYWAEIGDKLGHVQGVVGLTQDYGYRLAYWGWQGNTAWLTTADVGVRDLAGQNLDLAQNFPQAVAGKKYFVVTMFGELEKQPELKDILYKNYPIYAQTDEYVIFDLQHPLQGQP